MKFKVGDKVRVIGNHYGHCFDIGTVAEIAEVGEKDYKVQGKDDYWRMKDDELDLVSKKNIMKKLTPMLKTMLDKKGRTLYKAEFLNGDLELTEEGKGALMTILFEANKDELVKVAEDVIKESKE